MAHKVILSIASPVFQVNYYWGTFINFHQVATLTFRRGYRHNLYDDTLFPRSMESLGPVSVNWSTGYRGSDVSDNTFPLHQL